MRLKQWLHRQGISQRHFGALIGRSPSTVTRWVHGRVPNPEDMRAIFRATSGAVEANDFYALSPVHDSRPETRPGDGANG